MGYVVSERVRLWREERDASVRSNVRWWRRKRLLELYAIADRVYDTVRSEEAELAEARAAAQGSGERRAQ